MQLIPLVKSESVSLQMECFRVCQPHSGAGHMPRSSWPTQYLRTFNMKCYWIFQKPVSVTIEMITMWFLSLNPFMQFITLNDLYIELSLHLWNKHNLIMVNGVFDVLLNGLARILLGVFIRVDLSAILFSVCLYLACGCG